MTLSLQQVLLPQDGNCLRGGNLLHGHRHQNGVSDDFFEVFRLQAMAIPLVSDRRCKHYTRPTHASHARTRDVFSCGPRLKT